MKMYLLSYSSFVHHRLFGGIYVLSLPLKDRQETICLQAVDYQGDFRGRQFVFKRLNINIDSERFWHSFLTFSMEPGNHVAFTV